LSYVLLYLNACVYLAPLSHGYGVTRRHRSRDHSIRGGRLLNITLILYTTLRYVRNVASEE